MSRLSVLFVHQNFPGQFPHIASALAARGDNVAAIGSDRARGLPGVDVRGYTRRREVDPSIPSWQRVSAEAFIRSEGAARAALKLKEEGFEPDVIVGHPGFGDMMHLKEIFPAARVIALGEFYGRGEGFQLGFDPELDDATFNNRAEVNANNTVPLLTYVTADKIVCPTPFQASSFPAALREQIVVHHEGVDVPPADRPRPKVSIANAGVVLDGSQPLITYVARRLEPIRGFHTFMRALPAVMAARPDAHIVVLGEHARQGYGVPAPNEATWTRHLLDEVGAGIDASRFHAIGPVDRAAMINVLSLSWAHAYLTAPFVLSWSLLEAMACECAIIASDTAPVRDVIEHGVNGEFVDFFNPDELAGTLLRTLADQAATARRRAAARRTVVERYDRASVGVPGWLKLIDEVAAA